MAEDGKKIDLNGLLAMMVKNNASDLHIKAGGPVVFRIDGRLVKSSYIVKDDSEARGLIFSTMKENQIARLENDLELDYAYELKGLCRFRSNVFFQNSTISASFRKIPLRIPTIDELHLPEICKDIANFPNGLILVCGPTGCGKSTTLAAVIDHINRTRSSRIITIEDPIEYIYDDNLAMICQREVGQDTKTFPNALKEVLRQDPDVILVGEMRDLDTIAMALTAAETGHLVFATLHTQSAAKNVDRIIDVFPPEKQQQIRLQVSQSLRAVLSQRLIPMVKGPGRVPAVEIMLVNSAIENLIREQKTYQIHSVIQTCARAGMRTMNMALGELVARNIVSMDEAAQRADSKDELKDAVMRFRGVDSSASSSVPIRDGRGSNATNSSNVRRRK
jgi:twitching motility protein PilT